MKDVEVEREADGVLCDLIPAEQEVWLLDQAINARGFHFDRALAESARRLIKQLKPELNRELAKTTGGAVTTVDQIPRLKAWLGARGLSVHALDADAVTEVAEDYDDDGATVLVEVSEDRGVVTLDCSQTISRDGVLRLTITQPLDWASAMFCASPTSRHAVGGRTMTMSKRQTASLRRRSKP